MKKRALAVVIVLTVAADWATKLWVRGQVPLATRQTVVDGWLSFQHHFNEGIAFSWLGGLPDAWRLPLLAALTLAGMAATVGIVRGSADRWVRLAGALVLGGALGNLGDRLLDGGVTDFILVHFFPYVFNVADVAISAGGTLLVLRMLVDARRPAPGPTA
jgi:signal peptidase II